MAELQMLGGGATVQGESQGDGGRVINEMSAGAWDTELSVGEYALHLQPSFEALRIE